MAYTAIATYTLGSSGNFTFSSIPNTYKDLELRVTGKMNNAGLASYMTFNGDNPISGSNYAELNITYTYSNNAWSTSKEYQTAHMYYNYSSTTDFAMVVNIADYANTSWYKSVVMRMVTYNPYPETTFGGIYTSTSAISSILLSGDTTYQAGSTATLYGVS